MSGALLFDLDGTLTDPRPGFVRSVRYALDRLARPCPADDVLASFIGPPLRGTFAAVLETADRGLVELAMSLYRERYAEVGLFENGVYEGVAEMLEAARGGGAALFVATAKPREYAERIVRHFGLHGYFAGVYGAELGGRFDDKTDLLAHLLATEPSARGPAVMVGDRASDIAAARANGLRSVGALWGYGSRAELVGAGADLLCTSPAALMACLGRAGLVPDPQAPPGLTYS
jgi:phosphoglycolate phosphatase